MTIYNIKNISVAAEEEKYKGTYLEDFDFEYDCDFPEIEYSDYGADLRGGRH